MHAVDDFSNLSLSVGLGLLCRDVVCCSGPGSRAHSVIMGLLAKPPCPHTFPTSLQQISGNTCPQIPTSLPPSALPYTSPRPHQLKVEVHHTSTAPSPWTPATAHSPNLPSPPPWSTYSSLSISFPLFHLLTILPPWSTLSSLVNLLLPIPPNYWSIKYPWTIPDPSTQLLSLNYSRRSIKSPVPTTLPHLPRLTLSPWAT